MLLWLSLLLCSGACWAERESVLHRTLRLGHPPRPPHEQELSFDLQDLGSGSLFQEPGTSAASLQGSVFPVGVTEYPPSFSPSPEIYGNCKGQNFKSSVNNGSDISRIRVSFGNNRMIKGIRLKFGDEWDPWYGVNANSYQEVILWNKEHIVNVTGSRNAFISSLTFYTDQDRQFHFGTKSGIRFMAHGDTNGKVLRGINGKIQKQGICGIGFQWGYPVSPPLESVGY